MTTFNLDYCSLLSPPVIFVLVTTHPLLFVLFHSTLHCTSEAVDIKHFVFSLWFLKIIIFLDYEGYLLWQLCEDQQRGEEEDEGPAG